MEGLAAAQWDWDGGPGSLPLGLCLLYFLLKNPRPSMLCPCEVDSLDRSVACFHGAIGGVMAAGSAHEVDLTKPSEDQTQKRVLGSLHP